MRLVLVAVCTLLASCSCNSAGGMVVQLRSNFVPGIEFDEARTEVWAEGNRTPELASSTPMHWRDPVETGVQIADAPGIAPGRYTIVVTLRRAGSAVAQRSVLVTFEHARAVTVLVTRDCIGVTCEDGLTCLGGTCVPMDCIGGSSFDGCPTVTCVQDDDCEVPPIDCTDVMCLEGHCLPFPDHEACGNEEWCNPDEGCRVRPGLGDAGFDAGDPDGGPTDGGPLCSATTCDDGNPCTDDTCEATGCVYLNNTEPCDDGTFCNGPDQCLGGYCAAGTSNPCPGMSVCDEIEDTCMGCATDADCPADRLGAWGSCEFGTICAIDGTQQRPVTTYRCVAGMCTESTVTESGVCARGSTDGASCGTRSCPGWGPCVGFADECATSGTQTRTCVDRTCVAGTCRDVSVDEAQACSRSTDGSVCGAGSYCDGWGSCDYADSCDRDATQVRTCHDLRCSAGVCSDAPWMDGQSCTRSTEGTTCGTNPQYCGRDTDCHVCRGGVCAVNTPHYDAACHPSCGRAASLCGTIGTCCVPFAFTCPQVGSGPPYADCGRCCDGPVCY